MYSIGSIFIQSLVQPKQNEHIPPSLMNHAELFTMLINTLAEVIHNNKTGNLSFDWRGIPVVH